MPASTDFSQALLSPQGLPYAQALLADASVAAAAFDANLVCRYANPRFASLGGLPAAEGRSLFAILDLGADQIRDVRTMLDGGATEVSLDLTTAHGRSRRLGTAGPGSATWNARLFRTAVPGGGTGIGLVAVDVTPEHRLVEQLRHSATHDRLTGLLNAAGLADELAGVLARPGADPRRLLVLFGDLNGFKAVNDRIGHHAGDRVLQVVGQRLRDAVREQDLVARPGGDEFVVLVSEPEHVDSAARVVARLQRAVGRPITVDGARVSVGMTIGAVRTGSGDSVDSILRRADSAMRSERFAAIVGPGPAAGAAAGAGGGERPRYPKPLAAPTSRPGRLGLKRLRPLRLLRAEPVAGPPVAALHATDPLPVLAAVEAPESGPAVPAARHRAPTAAQHAG